MPPRQHGDRTSSVASAQISFGVGVVSISKLKLCRPAKKIDIGTITELVHGPTGLQPRLANARNRTRMDCASRGTGNGTAAASPRGDGDVRRRAYLAGAELHRLVHSHLQR